jgi:hypothetical protein
MLRLHWTCPLSVPGQRRQYLPQIDHDGNGDSSPP